MSVKVSVIIVNYNGASFLLNCLDAVSGCDYDNYEIIVVDNGSTDHSKAVLTVAAGLKSNLKTIFLPTNLGPAAARNHGARVADGEYLAFLDNDTRPTPQWLTRAVSRLSRDPRLGACQCMLLVENTDRVIDCIGEYLGQNGFLVHVADAGHEQDNGQFHAVDRIFAAKSAAMVVTRGAFDAAGGFDDGYFMYLEDTDLCWRIWLAGFEVIAAPDSVVYHYSGTTSVVAPERINFLVKYYGCRNYVLTIMKNAGPTILLRILPIHLAAWIGLALHHLARGQVKSAEWILQALVWLALHPQEILRGRRKSRRIRRVGDRDFIPMVLREKPFRYYTAKLSSSRAMGNTLGWDKGA